MEFYDFVLRKRASVKAIQFDGTLQYARALSTLTDGRLWPEFRGDKFTGRLGVHVGGTRHGDPDFTLFAVALDYIVPDDDKMRKFIIMPPAVFEALYSGTPSTSRTLAR